MKSLYSADRQIHKPYGRFEPDVQAARTEARFDAIDALVKLVLDYGVGHIVADKSSDACDSSTNLILNFRRLKGGLACDR